MHDNLTLFTQDHHAQQLNFYKPWLPETKLVPLVGEMLSAVEVEGLEGAHSILGEEVLGAARRSPVVEVAGVLGHLQKSHTDVFLQKPIKHGVQENLDLPLPHRRDRLRADDEREVVAERGRVDIHCGW